MKSPGGMKLSRSDLYHFLAEALSEPPDWLTLPGWDWPLTRAAVDVSGESSTIHDGLESALKSLKTVLPGSMEDRKEGYETLLASSGNSGLFLYEASAINGRLLGIETCEVERWYQAAGLEIPGAELPDHASLELEFLAFLCDSEQENQPVEEAFLKQHAARWLPQLGRRLAESRDPVYAPVGRLLFSWLELASSTATEPPQAVSMKSPQAGPECTLCMACLAACPLEAIRVQENPLVTRLLLLTAQCNGCGQCVGNCEQGALIMVETQVHDYQGTQIQDYQGTQIQNYQGTQVLFESPREVCMRCGASLASRAELNYVSQILAHPAWLALCPDCR